MLANNSPAAHKEPPSIFEDNDTPDQNQSLAHPKTDRPETNPEPAKNEQPKCNEPKGNEPGTLAEPENKPQREKRLAPRSSNQFRVGPSFSSTQIHSPVYNLAKKQVAPEITARLDRGFDLIDNEWIGYKRNYFTLVASFAFNNCPFSVISNDTFTYLHKGLHRPVLVFKIKLTSVCLEDEATAVTLVQHTAKRDRGPQLEPPVYHVVPGQLPPHHTMKLVANIRNGDKIDRCNRLFYLLREERQASVAANPLSQLARYPPDCDISLVARYERIQFLSAGCGNRKLASTNNKHYVLVVLLLAITESNTEVLLATTRSPPLIVRGRSPSNYAATDKRVEGSPNVEDVATPPPKKARIEKLPLQQMSLNTLNATRACAPLSPSQDKLDPNKSLKSTYNHSDYNYKGVVQAPGSVFTQYFQNGHKREDTHHRRLLSSSLQRLFGDPLSDLHSSPLSTRFFPDTTFCHDWSEIPPCGVDENLLILQVDPIYMPGMARGIDDFRPAHSPLESYQEAMRQYDEVDDLNSAADAFQARHPEHFSFPVPIVFPNTAMFHRSLQMQVADLSVRKMQPSAHILRSVARCKHGFKIPTVNSLQKRTYTIEDLQGDYSHDFEFAAFMDSLRRYEQLVNSGSPF